MNFKEKESYWMSVVLMVVFLSLVVLSIFMMKESKSYVIEWEITSQNGSSMLFSFFMDWMSLLFFGFVSMISSSVFFYSGSYMKGVFSYRLFMILVFLFVVSMFFLVFSLNLISMMLGWDGLGVISYILVVFYKNEKSSSAGMITALSNRIGDSALLLLIACFIEMGGWNYMFMEIKSDELVCALLVLAAITKSAQIPFSAWLPAAMAAPTPVSALVHSSTLVTAGVYILIRFSEMLKDSVVLKLLIFLGILTTLMSSLSALFEVDFKKVVALSTLSQLGIMIMTLAMGCVELAYIHLLTHAVFKSLLFLCSGKIIHSLENYQDIRMMGGLFFNLPITGVMMNISSFALCGIPFLSGFYSKDSIIEQVLMMDNFNFYYCIYMMIVGFSASYSFRLAYLSVMVSSNQTKSSMSSDDDWVMLQSKLVLVFFSIFSGAFLMWVCMEAPLLVSLMNNLQWLSLLSLVVGAALGVFLCFTNYKGSVLMESVESISSVMLLWNLYVLSGSALGCLSNKMSFYTKKLDLGWGEMFSGQGFNYLFLQGSEVVMIWLMSSVKSIAIIFIFSIFLTVWY